MLTLVLLAILLTAGIAAFAALGVEDTKFHASFVPARVAVAVPVHMNWEASLPGRKKLPWSEDDKA
jgi:hypothetical protein